MAEQPAQDCSERALQGTAIILAERIAADAEVDGKTLLDSIRDTIKRYVILDPQDAVAVALWIASSYAFNEFFIFPRLRLRSATKQCGKSTLLDVIESLVNKPLTVSNVTGAALVRLISAQRPVMLLDEADRYMRNDEDLTSIVNAGHKRNGVVTRCVGDDQEVRVFSAWAPMVIAAIRELPGTVEDRSITITMRRKTKDQSVQRFRTDRPPAEFGTLASKALRWAFDHAVTLGNADPAMPAIIGNRAADNWRPLLAVADAAGEEWGKLAREVAKARTGDEDEIRVRLLRDIKEVFTETAIHSCDLVQKLNAIEDAPWSEFQKGKSLSQAKLSHLLHDFGIKATQVKIGHINRNGFHREQFEPLFAAYLAPGEEKGSTTSTDLENKENFERAPLPSDFEAVLYPDAGRGIEAPGIAPEGRGGDAENESENNAVELVEANILPARCDASCAQCGGGDDEVYLFDGIPLHQECYAYRLRRGSL